MDERAGGGGEERGRDGGQRESEGGEREPWRTEGDGGKRRGEERAMKENGTERKARKEMGNE